MKPKPQTGVQTCNTEVLQNTALKLKETEKTVRSVIEQVFSYVHDRISDGAFESVYIRKFGKFRARQWMVVQIQEVNGMRETRKGMRQINKQQIQPHEIIRNRSQL